MQHKCLLSYLDITNKWKPLWISFRLGDTMKNSLRYWECHELRKFGTPWYNSWSGSDVETWSHPWFLSFILPSLLVSKSSPRYLPKIVLSAFFFPSPLWSLLSNLPSSTIASLLWLLHSNHSSEVTFFTHKLDRVLMTLHETLQWFPLHFERPPSPAMLASFWPSWNPTPPLESQTTACSRLQVLPLVLPVVCKVLHLDLQMPGFSSSSVSSNVTSSPWGPNWSKIAPHPLGTIYFIMLLYFHRNICITFIDLCTWE